jgi:hypothetical protein
MAVRSKRRFAFCEIGFGSLDPFDQRRWINPTLPIEAVRLLGTVSYTWGICV